MKIVSLVYFIEGNMLILFCYVILIRRFHSCSWRRGKTPWVWWYWCWLGVVSILNSLVFGILIWMSVICKTINNVFNIKKNQECIW